VDEGCGNYNASAEVSGEQIDEERDTKSGNTPSQDREEGCRRRDDQDDEQGWDACSQPAIVTVVGSLQSADKLGRISCGEVDIARVELRGAEVDGRRHDRISW